MLIQGIKLFSALNHSLTREQKVTGGASDTIDRSLVPKVLEFQAKFDRASGVHMVELKKVHDH